MTATDENIAADDPEKLEESNNNNNHRRVYFSFAAYSKAVIDHLRSSCRVPVTAGLSDLEFTDIECRYGFSFPPDLRQILREGLPIGTGFPDWRSSSAQQLKILVSLPVASLLDEVSRGNFWFEAWGLRPGNLTDCLRRARFVLDTAPPLVPIYRHFYIPSVPNTNGNPIFYIKGGEVRCWGLDVSDFFRRFQPSDHNPAATVSGLPLAAWAAKSARRVEVWSDLVGIGERDGERERGDTWQELRWTLREGGWREEEVREMLPMDGQDGDTAAADQMVLRGRDGVMLHVRLLALALLRAGWSTEEVAYAMGSSKSKYDTCQSMDSTSGSIEISLEP